MHQKGKILIFHREDSEEDLLFIRQLKEAYGVEHVHDEHLLVSRIVRSGADLILVEEAMQEKGSETLHFIRASRQIPLVLWTDASGGGRSLPDWADSCLPKKGEWSQLQEKISALLSRMKLGVAA